MMKDKIIGEGITFDDVLLVPAKSEILPHMAETGTKLTNKIQLHIPRIFSRKKINAFLSVHEWPLLTLPLFRIWQALLLKIILLRYLLQSLLLSRIFIILIVFLIFPFFFIFFFVISNFI